MGPLSAAYIYVQEDGGPLRCFQVTSNGFDPNPVSASSPISGGARGGMALSANGSQAGTGILWETTGKYNAATPAVLHAFDAANLGTELWNSSMEPGDAMDGFVKFVGPTVVNGMVYAASSDAVVVYGLLNGTVGGPAAARRFRRLQMQPATRPEPYRRAK